MKIIDQLKNKKCRKRYLRAQNKLLHKIQLEQAMLEDTDSMTDTEQERDPSDIDPEDIAEAHNPTDKLVERFLELRVGKSSDHPHDRRLVGVSMVFPSRGISPKNMPNSKIYYFRDADEKKAFEDQKAALKSQGMKKNAQELTELESKHIIGFVSRGIQSMLRGKAYAIGFCDAQKILEIARKQKINGLEMYSC